MSTNDVPGANPKNGDQLAMGCWAEHEDGSLIFVESTEGARVVYSIFDMAFDPPVEYRDAMPESGFKTTFSWKGKKGDIKWTWHDKTPFDWSRIIKQGAKDGVRFSAAEHLMSAARRVAESLHLRGREVDKRNKEHLVDQEVVGSVVDKLKRALRELER